MVDIPLRRVVRGPDIYVATWRLPDGAIVGHEITAQEYAALALKGAGAPPNRTGNARAVWIGAAQVGTFLTSQRLFQAGDVYTTAKRVLIHAGPTYPPLSLNVADVSGVDDRLSVDPVNLPPGVRVADGVLTVP